MIQRRARAAGIRTRIDNHSFRATGITPYLKNNTKLFFAGLRAGHAEVSLHLPYNGSASFFNR
jgi:hypothetical protein